MRQEVVERFNTILMEKLGSSWKDGWVYGRLQQEFTLQPDELEWIASRLGFKYGWNAGLKGLLEQQWQEQKGLWERYQSDIASASAERLRARELQKTPGFYSLPPQKKHLSSRSTDDLTSASVNVELNSLEYLLLRCIVSMPRREQLKLLAQLESYRSQD